ncbi:hypothetical protein GOV11_00420 [Candidatus Woesearchaeota archaeon]|nr:hypothetical protein [Candidatus Woesearchaeota archaeon]
MSDDIYKRKLKLSKRLFEKIRDLLKSSMSYFNTRNDPKGLEQLKSAENAIERLKEMIESLSREAHKKGLLQLQELEDRQVHTLKELHKAVSFLEYHPDLLSKFQSMLEKEEREFLYDARKELKLI